MLVFAWTEFPHLISGIWSLMCCVQIQIKRRNSRRNGNTPFAVKHQRNKWSHSVTRRCLRSILSCRMLILFPRTRNLLIKELCCTFLKTAKLWSRWSLKGKSPTLGHVSRTNRVALDWLFDRTNLDHKLQQSRYVDSRNQLADLFTTGHFTRDECCGCSVRNLVTIRRTGSSTVPSSTASSSPVNFVPKEYDVRFKESAERSGAGNKETSR